jgi:hypothetical protein
MAEIARQRGIAPGDIRSVRWAASNRNGERDHIVTVGDIISECLGDIIGIRKDFDASIHLDPTDASTSNNRAKNLPAGGIEINKLFRLERDNVMAATGGRQMPYTYGSLPGWEDYFFAP